MPISLAFIANLIILMKMSIATPLVNTELLNTKQEFKFTCLEVENGDIKILKIKKSSILSYINNRNYRFLVLNNVKSLKTKKILKLEIKRYNHGAKKSLLELIKSTRKENRKSRIFVCKFRSNLDINYFIDYITKI